MTRPGRFARPDRRAAFAAPAARDGFVSERVTAGGYELHVRTRPGPVPGAPPCLLLHGLAVSHRYLMPTARHLTDRPVHVPDLPGFGLSAKPPAALDVAAHARVAAALLERYGPSVVLGNSFGVQVAVELAAIRPGLVTALVLAGPTTDPAAGTMTGQIRRFLADQLHEDWRQIPMLARDIRDAGPGRVLRTLRHAVRDHIEDKLPTVGVPVLLMRGEHDRIAPQRWLDDLAERTPRAQTVIVPKAAHNVITTAGREVADAIRTWPSSAVAHRAG